MTGMSVYSLAQAYNTKYRSHRPLEGHILQTRFGNGYKHLSKLGSGYAFMIVEGHCQAKRFHCVYMHCVLHTQTSQLTTEPHLTLRPSLPMQVGLASGRALVNERAWSVSGAYIQIRTFSCNNAFAFLKKNNEKQAIRTVSRQTIVPNTRRDTMSSFAFLVCCCLQSFSIGSGLSLHYCMHALRIAALVMPVSTVCI
jgi:hypothetical protein